MRPGRARSQLTHAARKARIPRVQAPAVGPSPSTPPPLPISHTEYRADASRACSGVRTSRSARHGSGRAARRGGPRSRHRPAGGPPPRSATGRSPSWPSPSRHAAAAPPAAGVSGAGAPGRRACHSATAGRQPHDGRDGPASPPMTGMSDEPQQPPPGPARPTGSRSGRRATVGPVTHAPVGVATASTGIPGRQQPHPEPDADGVTSARIASSRARSRPRHPSRSPARGARGGRGRRRAAPRAPATPGPRR